MSEAAVAEIRERILNGKYPPGMHLRQEELANDLGMSRIPIREALFLLESEGILSLLPHKGAVVTELSSQEIEELFNLRLLLEPFLLLRSAPHLTSAEFELLDMNLVRYAASIDDVDTGQWNDLNTEFHMILYKFSDSSRMMAMVRNLLNECDRHTRLQLTNIEVDRPRAVSEHQLLLKLCREGRFETAAQLMREHIDHIRVALITLLRERKWTDPKSAEA